MKKFIIIGACVVFAVALFFFGSQVLAPTPEDPTLASTAPAKFSVEFYEEFGYNVQITSAPGQVVEREQGVIGKIYTDVYESCLYEKNS